MAYFPLGLLVGVLGKIGLVNLPGHQMSKTTRPADVASAEEKPKRRQWSTPILRAVVIKDLTRGIEGRGRGEGFFKRS